MSVTTPRSAALSQGKNRNEIAAGHTLALLWCCLPAKASIVPLQIGVQAARLAPFVRAGLLPVAGRTPPRTPAVTHRL